MKAFIFLFLIGCHQTQAQVAAPTIETTIPSVPSVYIEQSNYKPNVTWKISNLTNYVDYESGKYNSFLYKKGGITASISSDDRLYFICSNGFSATLNCFNDGANVILSCERMLFKLTCEEK